MVCLITLSDHLKTGQGFQVFGIQMVTVFLNVCESVRVLPDHIHPLQWILHNLFNSYQITFIRSNGSFTIRKYEGVVAPGKEPGDEFHVLHNLRHGGTNLAILVPTPETNLTKLLELVNRNYKHC